MLMIFFVTGVVGPEAEAEWVERFPTSLGVTDLSLFDGLFASFLSASCLEAGEVGLDTREVDDSESEESFGSASSSSLASSFGLFFWCSSPFLGCAFWGSSPFLGCASWGSPLVGYASAAKAASHT